MAEGQNIWWGVVAIEGHLKKGSVAGPVIQANGRLIFEEDWRPALLCFSEPGSASSLITACSLWGNPGMARSWRKSNLSSWIHHVSFFSCDLQDFKFYYVNRKAFGESFLY